MGPGLGVVAAKGCGRLAIAVVVLAVAACGGDGGGGGGPTPPDLAGVWAGSWQGSDPSLGQVTGTWEVVINQGASSASGPSVLFGDVDCMDGTMQTQAGNQTQVTGSLTRAPCPSVDWTLTALNLESGSATGSWNNAGTGGAGTLTGSRVARLTGPRIHFMHPPGGRPGTLVTVVGASLSALSGIEFSDVPQPVRLSESSTRIVTTVPAGAPTGAVSVTTAGGTALSPRFFSTNVTSPAASVGAQLSYAIEPAGLAVSPDGRKVYVADRSSSGGFVGVLRAAGLRELTSTDVVGGAPRSVVASPDGRRIYVAAAGLGVLIMDAAIVTLLDQIALSINDEGRDNPQGLAISPDGSLLLVSAGSAAGSVTLFRTADKANAGTLTMPAGVAPLGVAFSPDGSRFFVAQANLTSATAGTLGVYDVATLAPLDSEPVGTLPTAVAVSPDGRRVFVTNQTSNSVSLYDVATSAVSTTTLVGTAPTGIAHSPDGMQVYAVNRDADSVSVLHGITGQVVDTIGSVGDAPIAIAINPQGSTGYVGHVVSSPGIREIGGTRTLNIALGGTGIGRVTSSPAGIDCGTTCQAQFVVNSSITLNAIAQSGSFFIGWSGDGDCSDGVVSLNPAIVNCTAIFSSNTPPPSQSNQNCFIATAAYGSAMAPEVQLLREFRDRHLLTNGAGRAFVQLYYRHSPALAERIRHSDRARAAARAGLWPLVWLVRDPAGSFSILALGLAALGGLLVRRRRPMAAVAQL